MEKIEWDMVVVAGPHIRIKREEEKFIVKWLPWRTVKMPEEVLRAIIQSLSEIIEGEWSEIIIQTETEEE